MSKQDIRNVLQGMTIMQLFDAIRESRECGNIVADRLAGMARAELWRRERVRA